MKITSRPFAAIPGASTPPKGISGSSWKAFGGIFHCGVVPAGQDRARALLQLVEGVPLSRQSPARRRYRAPGNLQRGHAKRRRSAWLMAAAILSDYTLYFGDNYPERQRNLQRSLQENRLVYVMVVADRP